MSFTYDPTDISTPLAEIRTLTGDTNSNDALLTDEQINYFLSETANVYLAATNAVRRGILPGIARRIDRSGTGFAAQRAQITQHYRDLADDLEAKARNLAEPFFGGTSKSAADSLETDTDYLQPVFKMGQFDND